jgi:hypothetical protein
MAAPVLINAFTNFQQDCSRGSFGPSDTAPRMTEGADARFGAHPYWVAHGGFMMGFEKQRSNTP